MACFAATFFYVLPRIADYGDVWRTAARLSPADLGALAFVTVVNVVTFAPPFATALPGLGFVRALVVTQASTASTYLAPGGAAVGAALSFAMLRAWGFGIGAVTLAVAVVSVWNQLFLLGAPTVALALLTLAGGTNALLRSVALFSLAVFAAAGAVLAGALSRDGIAYRVGDHVARVATRVLRLFRRPGVTWGGPTLVRFRRDALSLLRRRWWWLTIWTVAGHLTVFLVLIACLRTLGVGPDDVSLTEAFAAWTLVRLLGSLPMTPGGVGVVELGLTGALIGFGGANAGVVAAVLLYRFLTIVPTLVVGALAAATWRRHRLRPS